ncbi:MAG: 4-(cytidine 5'-diphospho)-2-C-methyl-D-erythritol kinase [Nitrospirae bacterium]|nr:4-(cytidine 5'-diphospho)-2-C-methyl-D-erythritol kinase [Nitrospirota bacterium]
MRTFKAAAPAKLNLSLLILGKRDDGYHNIYSVMQKIGLADEIGVTVTNVRGIRILCDDPGVPADERNLAFRAADALFKGLDSSMGVRITIRKKVPVAAGLGGGSSDAAQTLLLLNRALALGLTDKDLMEVAGTLGSDVPFFISPHGTALATGRGDILQPIESADAFRYLIVFPGFGISTRDIYESWNQAGRRPSRPRSTFTALSASLSDGTFWRRFARNDLEPVAVALHPEVRELKRVLTETGAVYAAMSGSGPTVFGVFETAKDCRRALQRTKESGSCSAWMVGGA